VPLLGNAAIAMWWRVEEAHLAEFQAWHSREHLPERLGIPGFNRGSRWQREGGLDFFVVYELDTYETLTSAPYRARLDNPTPWSAKMMPRHLGMVRSQCRVIATAGRGVSTFMCTLRLTPGRSHDLEAYIASVVAVPGRPGVTGAHLLRTETPKASSTTEEKIRGGDAVADWIVLVSGHDAVALAAVRDGALSAGTLRGNGAAQTSGADIFRLVHVMTPRDV
jgi:hypothetical protein